MHYCSVCPFHSVSFQKYTQHIVRHHGNEANFFVNCCISNCQYSTKSWNAFKTHVSRIHSREVDQELQNEDVEDDSESEREELHADIEDEVYEEMGKYINAKFLLALKADHGLTERGVQGIIENTDELLQGSLTLFKNEIKGKMNLQGYDTSILDNVKMGSLFEGLRTKDQQMAFFKEKCGLIPPEPVYMGEVTKKIRGRFKQIKKYGYIVPFLKNIEKLITMPEVWFWIRNSHKSQNIMTDICDGTVMQDINVQHFLQVLLYLDEIEIVNPIGTHVKKHKLTMFYFTLANIPPSFRSRYEAIQLLAVAKTVDIKKYGPKRLLSDFISGINALQIEKQMTVKGNDFCIHGSLVMVLGDTPAAQWIGGFKEGVGFAYHSCRTCNASMRTLKSNFILRHFQQRDNDEHQNRCFQLTQMSKSASQYWSKCWGINGRSCLLDISMFNLSVSLVHDPMHILSEGIVTKEICCMLYHFLEVRKYFTLSWLNESLSSYSFSYLEQKDKPETIRRQDILEGKLKLTSACIMNLCSILPHLLGPRIPENDSKWKLFLKLVQITHISTSPYACKETVPDLEQLIYDHNTEFKMEYPKVPCTPKFHYLVHLPKQIERFGPGRCQWTMRFEGKHLFFKNIKWKCFKNLPYSVSMRHQLWMCWKQLGILGKPSESYLYSGDTVTNPLAVDVDELPVEIQENIRAANLHVNQISETKDLSIKGHCYRSGCVLVLQYAHFWPSYGVVDKILVIDYQKFFLLTQLEVTEYDHHIGSYCVKRSDTKLLVKYQDLKFVWPLSIHICNGRTVIMDKYRYFSEV